MDAWRKGLALTLIAGFVIVLMLLAQAAQATEPYAQDGFNPPTPTISGLPANVVCHEDEVVVMVVEDPYHLSPGVFTFGCVPADNLPATGYRP